MNSSGRSRSFTFVFYPDEENFLDIMSSVINEDTAFILHDKDTNENGDLKKPHYHVVVKFKEAKTCSSVAKIFHLYNSEGKLAENRVDICTKGKKDFKGALRYLTHANTPDKFQYPISDVQGSLKDTVKALVSSGSTTESNLSVIFNFILNSDAYLDSMIISKFCLENNCLSTFSSKWYYFKDIVALHNESLSKNK